MSSVSLSLPSLITQLKQHVSSDKIPKLDKLLRDAQENKDQQTIKQEIFSLAGKEELRDAVNALVQSQEATPDAGSAASSADDVESAAINLFGAMPKEVFKASFLWATASGWDPNGQASCTRDWLTAVDGLLGFGTISRCTPRLSPASRRRPERPCHPPRLSACTSRFSGVSYVIGLAISAHMLFEVYNARRDIIEGANVHGGEEGGVPMQATATATATATAAPVAMATATAVPMATATPMATAVPSATVVATATTVA